MAAPKFSLALGSKKITAAPPPKRKAALIGHDSDREDDEEGKAQEVSHFDLAAGGAIHKDRLPKPKEPLVIKGPPNRDWRDETRRKRKKSGLPGQTGAAQEVPDEEIYEKGAPKSYGLNIMEKKESKDTEPPNGESATNGEKEAAKKPLTDDERAIAALLGNKPKSDMVIPQEEAEEKMFERDYREAPSAPSLADYEAIPVEEFGAAMLRGMGWKDGDSVGKQRGQQAPKLTEVKRRPALLGIGAKQDAAVGVELGAWGKGPKGKKKLDQAYTPVMLENKKTGEKITEDELKARIENQKLLAYEHEKDRSRQTSDREYDSSSKHRRRHRDEDYDSRDREYRRKDESYDSRDKERRRREKDRDYDDRKDRSRRDRSASAEHRHRSKKDSRRDDYDDNRKHRSSRHDRSTSADSRNRSRKNREKDRKYDEERYESSQRDRSRSRDRRDRKDRGDRKEKHRDRGSRYEIEAR